MGKGTKASGIDVKAAIKEAVAAGIQAGRLQDQRAAGDAYKLTEKRLYAYPVLLKKLKDNRQELKDLHTHGTKQRSKSLARFTRTGVRLSPEEILEAVTQDLEAKMAVDQYEIDTIKKALKTIEHDQYYKVVYSRFVEGLTDETIAEAVSCDPSTVRRNRGRLIRKLAVWLYGAQAV